MNSSRIAQTAAVAAATGWTLKAIAIGVAGGLDRSPFEAPLFFLGLASFVVGTVAVGVALTHGRSVGWRVIGGMVALAVGFAAGSAVTGLVTLAEPEGATHWVWAEIGLWLAAALLLAVTSTVHGRRGAVDLAHA